MSKQSRKPGELDDQYLAEIVKIASEAIIFIDQSQRIIFFNKGAEDIFGYQAVEVIGQPLDLLLPPESRERHKQYIDQFDADKIRAKHMAQRQEISGMRKNGELFPAEASIARFTSRNDMSFAVILRDINERKQLEAALLETERNRVLTETAGATVHELMQPLNIIIGMAELIQEDLSSDVALNRDLQAICEQVQIIDRIVRNMQNAAHYKTKKYAEGVNIIDFDATS